MNTSFIFVGLVFLLSCCFDLVNSAASCFSCARGTNPLECLHKYTPSFIVDKNVCESIRNEPGEVQRLCRKYGDDYLVKCELEDLSEHACTTTCLRPSPRKGVVGSGNNAQTLRSSVNTFFAITSLCFFFLTL